MCDVIAPTVNHRSRYLVFIALVGVSIVIWWRPLIAVAKLAATNDAYTHIVLILPLTAVLIVCTPRQVYRTYKPGTAVGVSLLSTALAMYSVALWNLWTFPSDICLSLSMCAAGIWWVGSAILCFECQAFRRLPFPLSFLFLIVPIPVLPTNCISYFLAHQSALATTILFHVVRVPVMREGVLLSIPGLDIEVAHECSGIRSSMFLVVVTMFLGQLFLRSAWRKALLILAAIPLSIAKNALRIFAIAELGTRVDPGFLDGWLHHQGGIVFLSVGLAATGGLVWLLRHGDCKRTK